MKSIERFRDAIDDILISYLPKADSNLHKNVIDAMTYSFTIGGKRIRPMLMYGAYNMVSLVGDEESETSKTLVEDDSEINFNNNEALSAFMAAIEMIHTYSLIHDDLPAMDNDDLRRGKLTCHKVFGQANAILAGDGLLNYAFELMLKTSLDFAEENSPLSKNLVKASHILACRSGIYGMIGGQAADIKFENSAMEDKIDLDYIHQNKTGALIRASLMIGGILANCDNDQLDKLEVIGNYIGLSFQIQDDLLDINSSVEVLGKPIGSDEKNNKKTYVSFVGEDQSKLDIEMLLRDAKQLIMEFDGDITLMIELVEFLESREY